MFDTGYMLLSGVIMAVSMLVQYMLKSKFNKYSKIQLQNGLSGKEIAEKMLYDHGITDVQVVSTPGMLSDHYNPANKTVNLSEVVYHEINAAAAAVAAHECGHAVQHAKAYSMLQLRSKLVPIVQLSSNLMQWVILGGIVLMTQTGNSTVLLIGILMFAVTTLFAFVTLPVEYDASNRALAWLKNKNMVTQQEYEGSADALKWAARTYLVAALGSLAQLLYFLNIFLGRRSND
jgi:Zn-dependent membrane protease YugP